MIWRDLRRRLTGGALLLAILLLAGGLHNHADLAAIASAGFSPSGGNHVLSGHSPLSKASHWHSIVRAPDDACLACQAQRHAAVVSRTPGLVPETAGLFVSHPVPQGTAPVFRLGDPSRGPPSVS